MILKWLNDEIDDFRDLSTLMQSAADRAEETEGIGVRCAVSVLLCDDDTIREYNKTYRSVDRSTDVLSFPAVSYPEGKTAGACPALIRREYDDEDGACHLGDLIISIPHIYMQARQYGHSPQREAAYLLVHGLCHLMGYDHVETKDREIMRGMEEKILSSLGLSRSSSLSATDSELLEMARTAMKQSYSPYSGYPVGAALRCSDGRVFLGCNIENASFGLTNCAERTAVFKAVSEGRRDFTEIAIASVVSAPWPCGACRQVLNEFAPGIRVMVTWGDSKFDEKNLKELLPESFGPGDLSGEQR